MTKIKTNTRKTVATLEPNDCRWPVGDPRQAEFHFCGAPKLPGRPYCETHWQQAFQTPKPREPVTRVIGAPIPRAA
jgi:GcrA cell cycle regulator